MIIIAADKSSKGDGRPKIVSYMETLFMMRYHTKHASEAARVICSFVNFRGKNIVHVEKHATCNKILDEVREKAAGNQKAQISSRKFYRVPVYSNGTPIP